MSKLSEESFSQLRNKFFITRSGTIIAWGATSDVIMRLYELADGGCQDSKDVLLSSAWNMQETYLSRKDGWVYGNGKIWPTKYSAGVTDNEIAEHVKRKAVDGSTLHQKALILIAKDKLNGNCSDVNEP